MHPQYNNNRIKKMKRKKKVHKAYTKEASEETGTDNHCSTSKTIRQSSTV
jgi:hypothetical protein